MMGIKINISLTLKEEMEVEFSFMFSVKLPTENDTRWVIQWRFDPIFIPVTVNSILLFIFCGLFCENVLQQEVDASDCHG